MMISVQQISRKRGNFGSRVQAGLHHVRFLVAAMLKVSYLAVCEGKVAFVTLE